MLTQDSMGLILREVEIIIMEKMHFMKDTPRVQASSNNIVCTHNMYVTGFEKSHLPYTQQQDTLFTIKR